MKFICNGLDLSDAVFKVLKATAIKTTNPVLEGIKLKAENDQLTLLATDLEISIEKKIPADVKIEGETVVPGKFFTEFLKKLSNEQIEITMDKSLMKINYADSESFIQCFSASEFPILKKIENPEIVELEKKDLRDLINKTIFSVATDDSRPILKGCLFDISNSDITSVAVDGSRFALVRRPIISTTAETSIVIPSKSLNEICKFIDDKNETIKLYVQRNNIMVEIDNTRIVSRLMEGEFAKYKQILANTNTNTKITIMKKQLDDAIERAGLLARLDKKNEVRFDIKNNLLTITSQSELGNIKENITVSMEGKDVDISFNAKYLADCLKFIEEEYININFESTIKPFTITPIEKQKDYVYLIMPLRRLS